MSEDLTATVPAGTVEALPPLEDTSTSDVPQYYCLLTSVGSALEALAHASGKPVRLSHVAVGDGNGTVPTPGVEVTALVDEKYRKAIDSLTHDENDPNITWIQIVIPADVGGFWIREFGVYAEPLEEGGEPVLYAYGNHAPYYKLKHMLGQATTHELSIPLIMSSMAEVEIVISEAGYATRSELLRHVEASQQREITAAKDFISLSDRLTRNELAHISLKNEFQSELALLREREKAGYTREAGRDTAIIQGLDRLTRLELRLSPASLNGGQQAAAGTPLTAAGVPLGEGVTLAPVALVTEGSAVPSNAAIALVFGE